MTNNYFKAEGQFFFFNDQSKASILAALASVRELAGELVTKQLAEIQRLATTQRRTAMGTDKQLHYIDPEVSVLRPVISVFRALSERAAIAISDVQEIGTVIEVARL